MDLPVWMGMEEELPTTSPTPSLDLNLIPQQDGVVQVSNGIVWVISGNLPSLLFVQTSDSLICLKVELTPHPLSFMTFKDEKDEKTASK